MRTESNLFVEDLLLPLGIDLRTAPKNSVKLVRHMDSRVDLSQIHRDGRFEVYQAYQSAPVFSNARTLVSFLGKGDRQAVFVGVFDVEHVSQPGDVPLVPPETLPIDVSGNFYYTLRQRPGFDALIGRLVIDWGTGTRSWHQWFDAKRKPVVEVLPVGYVKDFPGYLNVILGFSELVDMIRHPTANREWHQRLGAVAGVYLVLDTLTGRQYVGSASGEHGVLGRWKSYAESGHAGNKQLRELVDADKSALDRLQFSILQTLDRSLTRREVLAFELLHKTKLGSRAHGLNSN